MQNSTKLAIKVCAWLGCISLLAANSALAHFPWLVRTEDGKAAYFFGDNVADRTYHLPETIAKAEVQLVSGGAEPTQLRLIAVDEDSLVGLVSEDEIPADAQLCSQVTFGIYHGARLDYYTQHQAGKLPTSREAYQPNPCPLRLMAELVDTQTGVDAYISWDGKPLADAEVKLCSADGSEQGEATTDAAGKVSFDDKQIQDGLNGIVVGYTLAEQAGTLDNKAYTSEAHYLTSTFNDPRGSQTEQSTSAPQSDKHTLAELPFAITSFGAARLGDAIYVYGGHIGQAHSYSTAEQSNQLLKLDISNPSAAWEKVTEGERLQGLALVAHGNRLITIGGFTALNAEGEPHNLHSQAAVRAFDVTSGSWQDLAGLPNGRSSHDAAILGDTIYVVGGWDMDGVKETQWHSTALALDLSQADPQWQELATPPFTRRALVVVAHAGKIYAIGGMDQEGGPTREVAVFDPKTSAWTEGPMLVGEEDMEGFGAAAWSIDGKLVATTYSGKIQQLNSAGTQWNVVGQTKDARFFNRLLPFSPQALISVGGANMERHEKYVAPELIELK